MKRNRRPPLAVVGLGKLGLPWACILASKGYPVVGIDTDAQAVERVNRGVYEGPEPRVAELLADNCARLSASTNFAALAETEMAFVVVPTPSGVNGRFSLAHVQSAIEAIARAVQAHGKREYLIVLVST